MSQLIINIGSSPNDGTGDPIRTAFSKTNTNFSELYGLVRTEPPGDSVGSIGDRAGMYAYDSQYFYWCYGTYDGTSYIWSRVLGSSF